jgi:hypothetical protein
VRNQSNGGDGPPLRGGSAFHSAVVRNPAPAHFYSSVRILASVSAGRGQTITAGAALWTVKLSCRAIGLAKLRRSASLLQSLRRLAKGQRWAGEKAADAASATATAASKTADEVRPGRERDRLESEHRRLHELVLNIEEIQQLQLVATVPNRIRWLSARNRLTALIAGREDEYPQTIGVDYSTSAANCTCWRRQAGAAQCPTGNRKGDSHSRPQLNRRRSGTVHPPATVAHAPAQRHLPQLLRSGGAPLPARLLGRIAVDPLAGVAGVGSPEQEAIERSGTD